MHTPKLALPAMLAATLMSTLTATPAAAGNMNQPATHNPKPKSTSAIKIPPLNRGQVGQGFTPGRNAEQGRRGRRAGSQIGRDEGVESGNIQFHILDLGVMGTQFGR
jgi:hypothetical protein